MQRWKAVDDEPTRKAARCDAYNAPPDAAFHLGALHRDILSLVLAALPVPYRVRVAARVCKQWRTLALASIASIALYGAKERIFDRALALLPSLTHVKLDWVRGHPEDIHLPASVTSLVVRTNVNVCAPLPTALTRLALRSLSSSLAVLPLLTASAATLQCLEFRDFDLGLASALSAAHYPALTCLRFLDLRGVSDALLSFVARHSSQLVRLDLVPAGPLIYDWRPALDLPYPSLTSLRLRADFIEITNSALPASLRTRRISLSLDEVSGRVFCGDYLTQLTSFTGLRTINLNRIHTADTSHRLLENLARHNWLPMVRKLTVLLPTVRPLLHTCVNLTKLKFFITYNNNESFRTSSPLSGSRLPHVGKLALLTRFLSPPDVMQHFVCTLSDACPNVQRLSATGLKSLPVDFPAAVCKAYPALLVLKLSVKPSVKMKRDVSQVEELARHSLVRVVIRQD